MELIFHRGEGASWTIDEVNDVGCGRWSGVDCAADELKRRERIVLPNLSPQENWQGTVVYWTSDRNEDSVLGLYKLELKVSQINES